MSLFNEIDTTLDGVKDLIESGLNIDEQISIFFNTRAMYCVMNDSLEPLQLLLQAGCKRNSLLSTAVSFSKRKCFDFLLTQGVDLNEINSLHLTPLHDAVLQSNRYFVSKLLEAGADLSIPNNLLPLYNATKSGSIEIVTSLIEYESPTAYLGQTKSPLFKAIKKGFIRIAYKLIEAGAYPDSESWDNSPIKVSIEKNSEKAFLLLLLSGASADKIFEDKLNENFRKIYNKFKCKPSNSANSVFENEIEQLIISLVQTQKEIKIFIDKSRDPSYLSKYLTPVINEINKKVVTVGKFVQKIESLHNLIKSYRKELLIKQLAYLEEIERNKINFKFEEDNNEWIELAKQTQDILKNCKIPPSRLPRDCFDQILALQDQFKLSKDEVFSNQSKLSVASDKSVLENRSILLSINHNVVKKLNQICSDAHDLIFSLSQVINRILGSIEQILRQMRDLVVHQQQLNFDFKDTDFELKSQNIIDDLLAEKKSQLDLDLAFLKIEKENFKLMSTNLLRLVRYCIS